MLIRLMILIGIALSLGLRVDSLSIVDSSSIFVGAGDIAGCSYDEDEGTAKLLDNISGVVFTLGDNAYSNGTTSQFNDCYDPTWGRHKARTRPVPGNHDYNTNNASGYFNYFGGAAGEQGKGYYSYNLGDWHIVALNSECGDIGGCDPDSPQGQWLKADLLANSATCTLAYSHRPRFSSGQHGNSSSMEDLWKILYDAETDILLSGHDHNYERFAPQDPNGNLDLQRGIRQFVVGTGGKSLREFSAVEPNSEVRESNTHGVLKLTLHTTGYDWEFLPIAGQTFTDTGSDTCHQVGDPTPAPTNTPTPLPSGTPLPTPTATDTPLPTSTLAPLPTATPTPALQVLTFTPSDDATIREKGKNRNYGSTDSLEVDLKSRKDFLLRFDVSGIGSATITGVTLRLFAIDSSSKGGDFHVTDTNWNEDTVAWRTAPPPGVLLGSLGDVESGSWYELDVTPLVTGDGPASLRVSSTNSNGADYSSKENSDGNMPALIIFLQ